MAWCLLSHSEYITVRVDGADQPLQAGLDAVQGLVVGYQHVDRNPATSTTASGGGGIHCEDDVFLLFEEKLKFSSRNKKKMFLQEQIKKENPPK